MKPARLTAGLVLGSFVAVCGYCASIEIPIGAGGEYGAAGIYYRAPDFTQPPPDAETLGFAK